jgi:DNA-binding NarL/FixJ family response regulator
MAEEEVSILIADDHEVVRRGLRDMLSRVPGWKICGEATNGREAVTLAEQLKPNVAVLDLQMPELNGIEATRKIKKVSRDTEVLIFTGSEDEQLIRDVFAANARSYILKTDISDHLKAAISALSKHKSYFTSRASEVVFAKFLEGKDKASEKPPAERITPREREIVKLLAEGMSNKDVANSLGISVKTAETHRAAIMRKLEMTAFADLVRYAIREKIAEA